MAAGAARPVEQASGQAWWQRDAIYQIYPRSFTDSDGDGVGDLAGIERRLDYLCELGVGAIWLSPIYPSPMADFGYDVADYCDVDPLFGTLADLDRLVAACHARGLRLILDWVPNHTSDRHPWFLASRSSRDDPKRDWYVWRDGRDGAEGGPPNDWMSVFEAAGSAWTFDEATRQWYLHSFAVEQPDLNWDNPEVEAAMHDVLRFWLDRGVDGFRVDAMIKIAKDPLLRDNAGAARAHHEDWDTLHARLEGIRRVVDAYSRDGSERMIVGEACVFDLHRFLSYLTSGKQLHLAHNFMFAELPWDAEAFRTSIDDFEELAARTAWPAWFLANHDSVRVASRFDGDGLGPARARAVLLMLYGLRGTPFVYQGEELGLPSAVIPPDQVVDLDGRDPCRAPIPWEPPSVAGPGAGFTTGTPWLPLVTEAERLCVARQAEDSASTLTLARRLARLRAETPALRRGTHRSWEAGPDVLAWAREADGERIVAAVNFAAADVTATLPGDLRGPPTLLVSSDPARTDLERTTDGLVLRPAEAVLVRVG